MADYLTKKAEFKCQAGKTLSVVSVPILVKGKSCDFLTKSNKLRIETPCTCPLIPTTPPTPCQMVVPSGDWLPGCFDPFFKICGNPALKKSSMMMVCKQTGTPIRCTSSGVDGSICTGASSLSSAGDCFTNTDGDSTVNNTSQTEMGEGGSGASAGQNLSETNDVNNQDKQSDEEKDKKDEEKLTDEDLYCQYNQKDEKCKQCKYREQMTKVDNNSNTLFDNYTSYFSQNSREKLPADTHYEYLIDTFAEVDWTYAAHHIISGNQIFNKYPKVVKLANFCGYDINNAKNCIMLLTLIGNKYPSYADTEERRSVYAYNCMKKGQAQWHVGHHNYGKFNDSDIAMMKKQIKLYTGQIPNELKDYAKVVSEEIDDLESELESNKSSMCWQSEAAKKSFCDTLDEISTKVKHKLGKFTEKPHRSYPYYVSQEAYRYAFNVPRSSKIMVVDWRDGKVILDKIIANRFGDTMQEQGLDLSFCHANDNIQTCAEYDLKNKEQVKDCIRFVAEYVNFVILSQQGGEEIKKIFTLEHEKDLTFKVMADYSGREIKDYCSVLSRYDSEILVWLRDIKCWNDEKPPSGMVKVRERMTKYMGVDNEFL